MTGAAALAPALQVAHDSPGRLRLRIPSLRRQRAAAEQLADHLAARSGVLQVAVRPRTGSVLCTYDARRTTAAILIAAAGQEYSRAAARAARPTGSVRRAFAEAFRGIDADVSAATGGRIDLGTLAGLGLLAAGAAEVAVTRQMPAPPWFSLAWWAFRTFTMSDLHDEATPVRDELAARRAAPRRARAVARRTSELRARRK